MLTRRILQLVVLLALGVGLTTADKTAPRYHHGRQDTAAGSKEASREEDGGFKGIPDGYIEKDGNHGMLRVRRVQDRGGSDNIPAAPRTASSITQPTILSTVDTRGALKTANLATISLAMLASTTPPPSPDLQARQRIVPLDPLGDILSLSSSLSSLSSSASSAIANISICMSTVQQSASSAIQSVQISAQSAISSAASSAASSASTSVSMALSSAWIAVENARSEIATVRAQADVQIQQAEGAVVSVTQAALGIVGAIIGSSILSIVSFYCLIRWRRQKRKDKKELEVPRIRKNSVGYPQSNTLHRLDPSTFAISPTTRTTFKPQSSSRARSMTVDSALLSPPPPPPRLGPIDTTASTRTRARSMITLPPPPPHHTSRNTTNLAPPEIIDPGFPSPTATAAGYTISQYGYGAWPLSRHYRHTNTTNLNLSPKPKPTLNGPNPTLPATPHPPTNPDPLNFSRRHTRTESLPIHPPRHQRISSAPSPSSPPSSSSPSSSSSSNRPFVPSHTRRWDSASTLGGIGVGGDLRSPLRRNVVSIFPRARDGGGVLFVRPNHTTSANGGMKDAPLPLPPTPRAEGGTRQEGEREEGTREGERERREREMKELREVRLSRVSEAEEAAIAAGQTQRVTAVRRLELGAGGNVSPFLWPYESEGLEGSIPPMPVRKTSSFGGEGGDVDGRGL